MTDKKSMVVEITRSTPIIDLLLEASEEFFTQLMDDIPDTYYVNVAVGNNHPQIVSIPMEKQFWGQVPPIKNDDSKIPTYAELRKGLTDNDELSIPNPGKYEFYGDNIMEVVSVSNENFRGQSDLIKLGIKDCEGEIYYRWFNLVDWCLHAEKVDSKSNNMEIL